MKRLSLLLACVVVLGGCSMFKSTPMPVAQSVPVKAVPAGPVDASGNPIELVPFRAGVSSATVERMAKAVGCTGGKGAGLLTPQGPVEVYKMHCDNGSTFKARCDMRQCVAI
jgi:hypothetical protein